MLSILFPFSVVIVFEYEALSIYYILHWNFFLYLCVWEFKKRRNKVFLLFFLIFLWQFLLLFFFFFMFLFFCFFLFFLFLFLPFLLLYYLLLLFLPHILLLNPFLAGNLYLEQTGLQLRDMTVFSTSLLRPKVCTTMAWRFSVRLFVCFYF